MPLLRQKMPLLSEAKGGILPPFGKKRVVAWPVQSKDFVKGPRVSDVPLSTRLDIP